VPKAVGDEVYAGTVNHEGYLEVKVSRRAGESTLAQIIHLVEQAEERRAPSEQFVRRFARYYTPAVVAVAVALMGGPALLFGADASTWFVRGLTLLVIACPCALVISTPVAVVSAITAAARQGVLVKGGIWLEALARVRVVALDKTGTITRGRMRVHRVISLDGVTGEEVLRLAAAAEQRSRHPIAAALVEAAGGDRLPSAEAFESVTGMGVSARIDGMTCTVGRPALFGNAAPAELADLGGGGTTVVLVGMGERVIGAVALTDTVRPGAREAVQALRSRGVTVVMLTGDHPEAAAAVASELGIEEWHAGLLPQEKLAWIERLEQEQGPVAMVGDGVNDAPALARATVGIAMGAAGSQVALETADVALMGDDLRRLPALLDLGRRTFRVVRQNVWASILVKFALAAGVFPGWVHLAQAVLIGDTGISLAVTTNALRLARTKPDQGRSAAAASPVA
jgi:Cd2+/Zn2+-exporting ATPase